MTSLIAWTGADSRGIASLNLASDSRITWYDQTSKKIIGSWDNAKKVFASPSSPDIFGYCGDSLIAGVILGQVLDALATGGIFAAPNDQSTLTESLAEIINQTLSGYPTLMRHPFTLLHGMRRGTGIASNWQLFILECDGKVCHPPKPIALTNDSRLVANLGTGRDFVQNHVNTWNKSDVGSTSRAVFSALCDSIRSGNDPFSGGPPQICRLIRKEQARPIGVVWNGKLHVSGINVPRTEGTTDIDWYNDKFERCNPATGNRRPEAQRQPRPGNV